MIEKREKKAIEDAKEQKVSETIRRKAGKVSVRLDLRAAILHAQRTWGKSKKTWKNGRL